MKKINREWATIKSLLNQGLKHDQIAEILGLSKQKMHYLMKIKIKTEKKRMKKVEEKIR